MTAASASSATIDGHVSELPGYRFTRDEYYRMAEIGLFDGRRVEFIAGKIVAMSPQNERHVFGLHKAAATLERAFGPDFWVRVQVPLSLGLDSDPEPDIAVIVGPRRLLEAHPTTAVLVVEVSDSTLLMDRRQKAGLYAAAGIAEYWVVNLRDRRLEVHRQPMADALHAFGWRYREVRALEASDRIAPLSAPDQPLNVADLLP